MKPGDVPSPLRGAQSVFEPHRDYLGGVAYRMLGSVSDAEDVLQDAFVRLATVDAASVRQPRAYLAQLVTRLCVDLMRSARVRRENYVGPWLPEPLVEEGPDAGPVAPDEAAALRQDVSLALMFALERLSPLERAAFILHDVFDLDYADVGAALDRDPVACRQLAARGRKRVRETRPRFHAKPEDGSALLGAFASAAMTGDMAELQRMLATDVLFASDGGGKVSAATKVVHGRHSVAKLVAGIVRKNYADGQVSVMPARVNGQPGFVVREEGCVTQAMAVDIHDGLIAGIYSVRNPDKLQHLNTVH